LKPIKAKPGHKIPTPARACTIAYHKGFLYYWGGGPEETIDLYRYDLDAESWEYIPVVEGRPETRQLFAAAIYNEEFYVFSGWDLLGGYDIDDVWAFDTKQLSTSSSTSYKWRNVEINRSADYGSYLPVDSYGWILAGS
jgi:hypothetical protein